MKVKDWLSIPMTKQVISYLEREGDKRLNAILPALDRDKSADITIGFLEAINLIKSMEEGDLGE